MLVENLLYEMLLVTRTNVTPVGVVRRGNSLNFKLFPGKSFRELKVDSHVAIQATNDPELLVRTALNLPVELEFEEREPYRWIKGLPGWLGEASCAEETWRDEIGETKVLKCSLKPEEEIPGRLPQRPFTRADCLLVEMAVLFTRYLVSPRKAIRDEILRLYTTYRRLGGSSESAEYIIGRLDRSQ